MNVYLAFNTEKRAGNGTLAGFEVSVFGFDKGQSFLVSVV